MQVSKWGNSLAIRLPEAVVEALNLKAGDEINIRVAGASEFIVEREPTREELIASIRKMGTPLPPGFKFTRKRRMPDKAFFDTNILVYAFPTGTLAGLLQDGQAIESLTIRNPFG